MVLKTKTFLLGICAGLAIGLGGFLFVLMKSINQPYLGSLLFAIGLFLVCTFGFYLYTGKIGFILGSNNKKDYILNLLIGYIGNIIGAVGLGYLLFSIVKDTNIINASITIAKSRESIFAGDNNNIFKEILSGMCCGAFVYIAVFCYKKEWNIFFRIFALVLSVFLFVASGFEHCVANMFYISMANAWNVNTILNILIITISNSIGSLLTAMLINKL